MTLRAIVLLSCGGAVLIGGPRPQAAVPRQNPEVATFKTEPRLGFAAYLYAPHPGGAVPLDAAGAPAGAAVRATPEPARAVAAATPQPPGDLTPVLFYSGEWGWRPLQQDT